MNFHSLIWTRLGLTVVMGLMINQADGAEIIAHRGASYKAPENTISAFKLAYEEESDAIELDMWLTKDNVIVCMHDASTSRTAQGNDKVISSTLYKDLKGMDVGSFKGEEYKGEPIPTLEEALDSLPENTRAYLEIKCGPEIAPYLKRVIRKSGKMKRVAIICFNYEALVAAQDALPTYVPCYWLIGRKTGKKQDDGYAPRPGWLKKARTAGFEGLDLDYPLITKAYVDSANKMGMKVLAWTVDDPTTAVELKRKGVIGITTNKPAEIRRALEKKASSAKPKSPKSNRG